jgi:Tol biopolymer transport system component
LIFEEAGRGGYDIHLLPMSTRAVAPWLITDNDEENERVSPDGRWIAYQSNETGKNEIFVRAFAGPSSNGIPSGGKWQVSRNVEAITPRAVSPLLGRN